MNTDNLRAYLSLPAVLAAGGSWMVAASLLADRDWDEVTRRTAGAVAAVQAIDDKA